MSHGKRFEGGSRNVQGERDRFKGCKLLPIDYTDEDLLARWEEFFESSENRVRVMEVAGPLPGVSAASR